MKATWTKEAVSGYREDGCSWLLTIDGERIGAIQSNLDNFGSFLCPCWKVESYSVEIFKPDANDLEFEVGSRNPRSVLAEAKRALIACALNK